MFVGWEKSAAGVLIVAEAPCGEPVFLLGLDAREKGGRWSDFSGGAEEADDTIEAVALREFREEAGGVIDISAGDLSEALTFVDTTPTGKTITRYTVRVPFDASIPRRFGMGKCGDGEKTELRWFSLRDPPRNMRRCFAIQMRRDVSNILGVLFAPLPVEMTCDP